MEARKIIITGGATRIGAAIAKKLSGPNIEILIHYNNSKSKAESLKRELEKIGAKIYLVKADLSKEKTDQPPGKIIDKKGNIACGNGTVLTLKTIQPAGKKAMDFASALNGNYVEIGTTFP